MSAKTKIEWTDRTWNPVRGCSRVSEGCRNCYAERIAARFSGKGQPYEGLAYVNDSGEGAPGPHWTGEVRLIESALAEPLKWRKPCRVFVNSMSDLFHEGLSDEQIDLVFAVMALSSSNWLRCNKRDCEHDTTQCGEDATPMPVHTFQILTKRPSRMIEYMNSKDRHDRIIEAGLPFFFAENPLHDTKWPLPNVWLGVSVENQKAADERIPLLLQTPATVRFLSCEPLLGPIDLKNFLWTDMNGNIFHRPFFQKLHWVIVGGESGPGARPMHPDWARSIRDQCQAAGVLFFFKQWGEWAPNCLCHTRNPHRTVKRPEPGKPGCMFHCGKKAAGAVLDGREWRDFPG